MRYDVFSYNIAVGIHSETILSAATGSIGPLLLARAAQPVIAKLIFLFLLINLIN